MEIHMTPFPTILSHRGSSRNIHGKDYDNQICIVYNFSRFSSIKKHFRNDLVVTSNMSTYEK